jgi:hypothetical protein
MIGGFLVKGFRVRFVKDGVTGNSIFRDFQFIYGLYLSSQESPRITGDEGVLIMLNTMELLWLPNFTSKGAVSWVTSPEDNGHPSITSTCARLSFLIIRILLSLVKFSSKKQAEASKSNKAIVLSL